MAVETHVVFFRTRLLRVSEWNQFIEDAGFGLVLDETCDPETQLGFWPCELDGDECGFEFSIDPANADELAEHGLALNDGDSVATFATRSQWLDNVAASIGAALLAKATGGVVIQPDGARTVSADEALKSATALVGSESQDEELLEAIKFNDALGEDQQDIDDAFAAVLGSVSTEIRQVRAERLILQVCFHNQGPHHDTDILVLKEWSLRSAAGDATSSDALELQLSRASDDYDSNRAQHFVYGNDDAADTDNENEEEAANTYHDQRYMVYDQCQQIAQRLDRSVRDTTPVTRLELPAGIIQIRFANGSVLKSPKDDVAINAWRLIHKRLEWFVDDEGVNVKPL